MSKRLAILALITYILLMSARSAITLLGYDRVHELGCYLEVELSSYIGVLRARFG